MKRGVHHTLLSPLHIIKRGNEKSISFLKGLQQDLRLGQENHIIPIRSGYEHIAVLTTAKSRASLFNFNLVLAVASLFFLSLDGCGWQEEGEEEEGTSPPNTRLMGMAMTPVSLLRTAARASV